MLVLVGIATALIVFGLVRLARYEITMLKRDAFDISQERYVKGQISEDEFEKIKQDLC